MSEGHAQARTTPRTRGRSRTQPHRCLSWQNATHQRGNRTQVEAIVVALRSLTLLALDDLVAVVHEFINPDISRS